MITLAQMIPAKWRRAIYSILGTVVALEAIFDVVPAGWESKILATLVVFGFGTAAVNVRPGYPKAPEDYPGEFA